jgi:hypothetical protein
MKKEKLILFLGYFALILGIPYIIVMIAENEQQIINLFFIHVVVIIPVGSILLKWYRMKNKGFSNKEIFKSFIPFLR